MIRKAIAVWLAQDEQATVTYLRIPPCSTGPLTRFEPAWEARGVPTLRSL
jgi:hypothetical protein